MASAFCQSIELHVKSTLFLATTKGKGIELSDEGLSLTSIAHQVMVAMNQAMPARYRSRC
jgi:hypothetical protein